MKITNEISNDLSKKTNWDDFSNTVSGSMGHFWIKVDCSLLNSANYFADHKIILKASFLQDKHRCALTLSTTVKF